MCLGRESNPHPVRDTILSRARIPIPPPRQFKEQLRRRPESNRRMVVLQTTALPLRHYAFYPIPPYLSSLAIICEAYNSFARI